MKKLIFVTWLVGCSADSFTTNYAIAQGAREVILTQSIKINAVIIGTECGIGATGLNKLSDKHPKLAILMSVGLMSLKLTIGGMNMNQVHKMRR